MATPSSPPREIPTKIRLSSPIKLLLVALSFVPYFFLHFLLPIELSATSTIGSLLPIVIAAYFFGIPGSLTAGVLSFLVTTLSLYFKGAQEIFTIPRLSIIPVVLLTSFIAGLVRNLIIKNHYSQELLKIGSIAAQEGLWDYDIESGKSYYSPRWFTLIGYEKDELPHTFQTFMDLVHPEDKEELMRETEAILESKHNSFSLSFRMREKNGNWKWILSRGIMAEKNPQGKVTRMVGVHSDINDLKKTQDQLEFLAYHDELTGLYNRKAFYEFCEKFLAGEARKDSPKCMAVVMLDIDDFKSINDSLGHRAGDLLIQYTSDALKGMIRKSDLLCRWGGDEFIMLLTNLTQRSDAAVVADKIAGLFRETIEIAGYRIQSGISLGIAMYGEDGTGTSELIKNADTAMYVAKKNKELYRFFEASMHLEATKRMELLSRMRGAVANQEFQMHYQPILNAQKKMVGVEALIRWFPPNSPPVSPGDFIPVAEDTGMIEEIGKSVLIQSIEALKMGNDQDPDFQMAVNISPVQLRSSGFCEFLEGQIGRVGINPKNLVLELTENSFLEYGGQTKANVEYLISLGLSFAIDDFGTGFSTLAYLKELPIAKIKIDQSFVRNLPGNAQDSAIVKTILTLSKGLKKQVVVEGVETADQLAFFDGEEGVFYQGYYFSKPIPWKEIQF